MRSRGAAALRPLTCPAATPDPPQLPTTNPTTNPPLHPPSLPVTCAQHAAHVPPERSQQRQAPPPPSDAGITPAYQRCRRLAGKLIPCQHLAGARPWCTPSPPPARAAPCRHHAAPAPCARAYCAALLPAGAAPRCCREAAWRCRAPSSRRRLAGRGAGCDVVVQVQAQVVPDLRGGAAAVQRGWQGARAQEGGGGQQQQRRKPR